MNSIEIRALVFDRLNTLVVQGDMQLGDIPKIGNLLANWIETGEATPAAAPVVPASQAGLFSGKPTVKYDGKQESYIVVGQRAHVFVAVHPGISDSYNTWVSTSEVLSYDGATGEFETRNTKYVPL